MAGSGTAALDSDTAMDLGFASGASSNWWVIERLVFLFNVSVPGAITAVTLSLYCLVKSDGNSATPNINIYASNPASNTTLTSGDYATLGNTEFATSVAYSSIVAGSYTDWTLNASGIAAIPASGIAKLGARNANHDAANSAPSSGGAHVWSYFSFYTAEQGSGYKPKLVITYSTGETKTSSDTGNGAEVITLRSLETSDQGSGVETALMAASIIAGDTGSGNENENISGQDSYYVSGADEGRGADSVKAVIQKSGTDLKLHNHVGQLGIPNKEVNI